MKKIIFLTILTALLLPVASALALEIAYPTFGNVNPEPSDGNTSSGPAVWVAWIFYAALGLVGVAAVGSLVYAGIKWMTSRSESGIADARSRIWAAILGILLVAGSYIILNEINPDLTDLRAPSLDPDIFQKPNIGGDSGPGSYGSTCQSNTDCGVSLWCKNAGSGGTGTCETKTVSGSCSPANNGAECRSGICGSGGQCVSSSEVGTAGRPCNANGLCSRSGLICENNLCKVSAGLSCQNNNECASGNLCIGGVCDTPATGNPPGTLLGVCRTSGSACGSGLRCQTSTGLCKLNRGEQCSNSNECVIGTCQTIGASTVPECQP